MADIVTNIARVRDRILAAARAANRDPVEVRLLAISKTRPVDDIEAAIASGQRAFGENYLQDALPKIAALRDRHPDLEWHFIGAIQSNKTRDIAANFDWVHTLERAKIARRLSEQRPAGLAPLQVCIQVNISGEDSKAGIAPGEVLALARDITALPNLQLRGLMAIPAASDDPVEQAAAFAQMKALQAQLAGHGIMTDTLSMGMSDDLEAAIAEGSTIVRIGTAIFGART